MFLEILNGDKPNPTIGELSASHIELETLQGQVQSAYDEGFKSIITSQQIVLGGGTSQKKVTESQKTLNDLEQKLIACENGMETIRGKLGEKILSDAQNRLETIPEELIKISEVRTALRHEYLVKCAEAAHLLSKITGLGGDFPVPKLDFSNLSQGDAELYVNALEKIKPKNYSVNASCDYRISRLQDESEKVGLMIDNFKPDEAVIETLRKAGSNAFPVKSVKKPESIRRSFLVRKASEPEPQPDSWEGIDKKRYYQRGEVKFTPEWYERNKPGSTPETEEAAEPLEQVATI